MNLLAIDASEVPLGVALENEQNIFEQERANSMKSCSEELLQMVREVLDESRLSLTTLDAIIVANGPGSFTGLRVAIAVAKGFSLALSIPIIPLSKLDAALFVAAQQTENRPLLATTLSKPQSFFYAMTTALSLESFPFKTEKGMASQKEIEQKQKEGAFIIGSDACISVDLRISAKDILPLGRFLFEKNLFAKREDVSLVYTF